MFGLVMNLLAPKFADDVANRMRIAAIKPCQKFTRLHLFWKSNKIRQ